MAASTSSKVAPGFSRNRITPASLTPVAVETTLTPPDCVAPPTVIEDLVTVSVRVGSVEAAAAALTAIVPPTVSRALAVMARSRVSRFIDDLQRVGVGKMEENIDRRLLERPRRHDRRAARDDFLRLRTTIARRSTRNRAVHRGSCRELHRCPA